MTTRYKLEVHVSRGPTIKLQFSHADIARRVVKDTMQFGVRDFNGEKVVYYPPHRITKVEVTVDEL